MNIDEKEAKAKKWGRMHGYYGASGGWIYKTDNQEPICQGWHRLYDKYRRIIENWLVNWPEEA